MTLLQLESRITRAELRMQLAISRKWKRLWSCAFIAAVSEKRAQERVGLVRHPGVTRDVKPGLHQEAHRVLATSGKDCMSSTLDRQAGAK